MQLNKNRVFPLLGRVQHYGWGGHTFIPELLGRDNIHNEPFAEYWLGAHLKASSEILLGDSRKVKLSDYIGAFPEHTLGIKAYREFGRLPYLLKILDVKDMLSIQVHPSKQYAQKGFARENEEGIPLDQPHRNYKDDNHKPELMLALSEFWLLHGFKQANALKSILERIPEISFLTPIFERGGYRELYRTVMEMDTEIVHSTLHPLLDRLLPLYREGKLKKQDEHFWAARAALTYNEPGRTDRGIFSIYLFNLVRVPAGHAVFQDAGLPHAYLEGQNVELMASSDNVLRGGLTPKHIDVHELLQQVRYEATQPDLISASDLADHIVFYPAPTRDFRLSRIELASGESVSLQSGSAETYFVIQGAVEIHEGDQVFICKKGHAFISFDQANFMLTGQEKCMVYKASPALSPAL